MLSAYFDKNLDKYPIKKKNRKEDIEAPTPNIIFSFIKKLFEKFDNSARERTKQFLRSQGCEVVDNPNQYGVDLIAEKNGKKYFLKS